MDIEHKSFPVEVIKADAQQGIIEAIVAVMGNIDHGDDVIYNGAFTKTLTERGMKVKILDNHNSNSVRDVIGKPISIKELSESELPPSIKLRYPESKGGLYTITQFDMNDENAKTIFNKLANGFVDEWSIGFTIPKGKQDYQTIKVDGTERVVRNIREVVLYEYSPVIWAMNSATATVGAKSLNADEEKQRSLMETYYDIIHSFEVIYLDYDNYVGYIALDVFDNFMMLCRPVNIETEYKYYMLGYEKIADTYAFDPIEQWIGGNFTFVGGLKENEIDLETKQGKVLSQRNFDKITTCRDMLDDVLKSAVPMNEDMPIDEEMNNSVTLENLSDTDDLAKSQQEALTKQREDGLKFIDEILKNLSNNHGVH